MNVPNSPEIERNILGALLFNIEIRNELLSQLEIEDFYYKSNKILFKHFLKLKEEFGSFDITSLTQSIKNSNEIVEIGGLQYIIDLSDNLSITSDLNTYVKMLKDIRQKRNLINYASEIQELALDGQINNDILVSKAIDKLRNSIVNQDTDIVLSPSSMYKVGTESFEKFTKRKRIETGFKNIDELIYLMYEELSAIVGRPSMGKCIKFDSKIPLQTGELKPIYEIDVINNNLIPELNTNNLKLTEEIIQNKCFNGIKPCYKVTTHLGKEIEVTNNHQFLTINGWKELKNLKIGDYIATPRILPIFGTETYNKDKLIILAHLIADGSLSSGSITLTESNQKIVDDLYNRVKSFDNIELKQKSYKQQKYAITFSKIKELNNNHIINNLKEWIKELGLYGKKSENKFIPDFIFKLTKEHISVFLNRLFATDGWCCFKEKTKTYQIGYCSKSKILIYQIQHLLLRFGILSRITKRKVKKYPDNIYYSLNIINTESIKTFINDINIFNKENILNKILSILHNNKSNLDLIPMDIWKHIKIQKGNMSWSELQKQLNPNSTSKKGFNPHPFTRQLTRNRLFKIGEILNSNKLKIIANSDIFWDKIESIEYTGEFETYDLTINNYHNFIANDIIVHNSGYKANIINKLCTAGFGVISVATEQTRIIELVRHVSLITKRPVRSYLRTRPDHEDYKDIIEEYNQTVDYIANHWNFHLICNRKLTVSKVRQLCTQIMLKYPKDFITIDLFDKLADVNTSDNKADNVAVKLGEFNQIAEELRVHICILAQLNREIEKLRDKHPSMAYIKGSGAYEEICRVIMGLYRERVYNSDVLDDIMECSIIKQNNGPYGPDVKVEFAFDQETLEMIEM